MFVPPQLRLKSFEISLEFFFLCSLGLSSAKFWLSLAQGHFFAAASLLLRKKLEAAPR